MTSSARLGTSTQWAVLEANGQVFAGEYRVIDIDAGIGRAGVMIGVDTHGRRLVIARNDGGSPIQDDTRSQGVQLLGRRFSAGGVEHEYCVLICMVPRLSEVFAALADDVISRLASSTTAAVDVLQSALDEWRNLLARALRDNLTIEQLVGLFAEVWVLRKLLPYSPSHVRAWVGPNGARHDFVFANGSLEVKATLSRRGRAIHINGLEQLEPLPGRPLSLAFVRLEEVPTGGMTLSQLVESIRPSVADEILFTQQLHAAGYDETSMEETDRHRFLVTEHRVYRVDSSFPALRNDSFRDGRLPPGIARVEYEVDLTGAAPVPLSEADTEALLGVLGDESRDTP